MTEPICPYQIDFWKPVDKNPNFRTRATREDATEAELSLGRIRYSGTKFKLPEQGYELERYERFLNEAYRMGIEAGKAQVRQVLGIR